MFKKNKKQTETLKEPKEKKVRTIKVGTHKKAVIALWVVLLASVSFGVYKNFTAIDQHTTHEKEIIELRLQDTDRKSTRLNSSHVSESRMPSSA